LIAGQNFIFPLTYKFIFVFIYIALFHAIPCETWSCRCWNELISKIYDRGKRVQRKGRREEERDRVYEDGASRTPDGQKWIVVTLSWNIVREILIQPVQTLTFINISQYGAKQFAYVKLNTVTLELSTGKTLRQGFRRHF